MAAYNAAPHIEASLASVARQSCADWELIVVDDGSADATSDLVAVAAARDVRIRYHRLPQNGGAAAARNAGMSLALGDWITVLDSDDRYEPDRLETLLERAQRDDLDLIADNLSLCDAQNGAVICRGFSFNDESCALTPKRLVVNDGPPRIASLGHLKPFIRRSFLVESGITYPVDARLGEDFCFLFLLLEKTERARLLDYAGYLYTLPFGVASGRQAESTRTSYGFDGLEDLWRTNTLLLHHVAQQATADAVLIRLLKRRGNRLRDEGVWRQARQSVKARKYLRAAWLLSGVAPSFGYAQILALVSRRRGRFETSLS